MYTINVIRYYFDLVVTWVSHYVMYLYNEFMEFSLIIKIAAVSLSFSLGLIIMTLLRILYKGARNRRWKRMYEHLDKRYGDGISYTLSPEAGGQLTRHEIMDALDLDEEDRRGYTHILKNTREKLQFARLVYHYRISDEASLGRRKNLHILLDIFEIPTFLEEVVNNGRMKRKAEALHMMRAFKLPVNQWIANQLRNSKRSRMRRLTMYASIMSSSNSDLEYFESKFFDNNCCIYDEIQLGYVLQRRLAQKRKLPNLAQLANAQTTPSTQAVFVRLMRQFNQKEYCHELDELFHSSHNKELIQEICRTWGYLHYFPGEEMMQEIILTQPEDTKITIMHALARMKTGKSLQVLVDGYKNNGSEYVKYEALRCLFNYGKPGYLKFKELESVAQESEKQIFEFFNNPLTREETKLSQDDIYESRGAENLYSVV